MADSAHGADEIPPCAQRTENTASADPATEDRGAHGDVSRAVYNVDAHVHRDAAPARGQTAYPAMVLSAAALGAHDANNAGHAVGNIEAWAHEQSRLVSSGHHIPPQSPQQSFEISRVAALNQHRRDYHDPDELPSDLAGQTADSTGETTLPPIRPLLDLADAQAQHRVLPPGHLRDTPNNWVPERDISYGHRMARLEALRFEIAFHELDYTLYCLHHDLQRHLCERCEGCRMQFAPLRPP